MARPMGSISELKRWRTNNQGYYNLMRETKKKYRIIGDGKTFNVKYFVALEDKQAAPYQVSWIELTAEWETELDRINKSNKTHFKPIKAKPPKFPQTSIDRKRETEKVVPRTEEQLIAEANMHIKKERELWIKKRELQSVLNL